MKRFTIAMVGLLLVGIASGQSEIGQQEDFEDDTIGNDPAGAWYTYSEFNFAGSGGARVSSDGMDATANAFRAECTGSCGTTATATFTLNEPRQFQNMTFFFNHLGSTQTEDGNFFLRNGAGQTIIDMQFNCDVAAGVCTNKRVSIFRGGSSSVVVNTGSGSHFVRLEFDFSADKFNAYIDGNLEVANANFVGAPLSQDDVKSFAMRKDSAFFDLAIDQVQFDGGPVVGEDESPSPSEFDSGLLAFAASFGFISKEAQMLFALILVGAVTVTTGVSAKWVSPGRFKNYLIMGAQALIAVFCVIATFLELWMFLVALMLGVFAVRGAKEARNTWSEIKQAVAESRQPTVDSSVMLTQAGVNEAKAAEVEAVLEAAETAQERIEAGEAASEREGGS